MTHPLAQGDPKHLLSVIIASYNNAADLRPCLDSVLRQTYRPLEILIADDASTDDSIEILREYETSLPELIRVIRNETNQGVARNRHNAIVAAKGQWFVTLDADDTYEDGRKLELEVALLNTHLENHGQDIAAFSNILLVFNDGSPNALAGGAANIREGLILPDILSRSCMIPRDFVISRETYFAVGGYAFDLPIYEDWDLKIRLAERLPFYYTGFVGTAYRRHGRGLSSAPPHIHKFWLQTILDRNIHRVPAESRVTVQAEFKSFIERL